jgi:hypothetical protein
VGSFGDHFRWNLPRARAAQTRGRCRCAAARRVARSRVGPASATAGTLRDTSYRVAASARRPGERGAPAAAVWRPGGKGEIHRTQRGTCPPPSSPTSLLGQGLRCHDCTRKSRMRWPHKYHTYHHKPRQRNALRGGAGAALPRLRVQHLRPRPRRRRRHVPRRRLLLAGGPGPRGPGKRGWRGIRRRRSAPAHVRGVRDAQRFDVRAVPGARGRERSRDGKVFGVERGGGGASAWPRGVPASAAAAGSRLRPPLPAARFPDRLWPGMAGCGPVRPVVAPPRGFGFRRA